MRDYSTQGIVIKKFDLGEADRVFTIYTRQRGKIQVRAKGVRKSTAKFKGHLELFNLVNLVLAKGRYWDIVTGVETMDNFFSFRKSLQALGSAYYISELIDKMVLREERDERIWKMIHKTFEGLDVSSLFLRFFEFNLLSLLGYQPELYRCVQCQVPLKPQKNFFSAKLGGVLCLQCARYDTQALAVTPDTIKILRLLAEEDFSLIKRLKLSIEEEKRLESCMRHFVGFVLGED